MKLIKQNKSLFVLLIVVIAYVMIVAFFINPLIDENNKLAQQKSEILISKQEQEYIQVFNEQNNSNLKDKKSEDIVLSIEKSIGDLVDINSIDKQYEQADNSKTILLTLSVSSSLENIFKLDKKLKDLELENSIDTIKIEKHEGENNKSMNCTIVFKVD